MANGKTEREQFVALVQQHERTWGDQSYPGRPDLFDILHSPVVVFWEHQQKEMADTISLYDSLEEIEKYYVRVLATNNQEAFKRRIVKVFHNQERVVVKGVKIMFGKPQGDE